MRTPIKSLILKLVFIASIVLFLFGIISTTVVVYGAEIRCYKTSLSTTVCKDSKGIVVKTMVVGMDGTVTTTTKEGTKRCFLINGEVICR